MSAAQKKAMANTYSLDKPQPLDTIAHPSHDAEATSPMANAEGGEDPGFLLPPQDSTELGRIAHYRVLKMLGKGGMGMVFLAVLAGRTCVLASRTCVLASRKRQRPVYQHHRELTLPARQRQFPSIPIANSMFRHS